MYHSYSGNKLLDLSLPTRLGVPTTGPGVCGPYHHTKESKCCLQFCCSWCKQIYHTIPVLCFRVFQNRNHNLVIQYVMFIFVSWLLLGFSVSYSCCRCTISPYKFLGPMLPPDRQQVRSYQARSRYTCLGVLLLITYPIRKWSVKECYLFKGILHTWTISSNG